jgi:hypothetical protein
MAVETDRPGGEPEGVALAGGESQRFEAVECELLGGERILLVHNKEDHEDAEGAPPDLVAYLTDELRELERLWDQPALVRAAHLIKKTFCARVVPPYSPLGRWSARREAIPAERFHGVQEGE